MARSTLARLAAASSVVAAVVAGVASPAWAPKYILGSFAFGTCSIDDVGDFSLSGDLTVESFSASGGTLYVNGMLTGSCLAGIDHVAAIDPGVYSFPVVDFTAECNGEFAGLDIRPGAARLGGVLEGTKDPVKMTLDLYPSTIVERTWMPGDPMSVRGRLCAISKMSGRRDAAELARALNQLVLRV